MPTLDKAIEVLEEFDRGNMPAMPPALRDANKLGIEALKRVELARKEFGYIVDLPLPGETEE